MVKERTMNDISPNWKGSTAAERQALARILEVESTPLAILLFNEEQRRLGDYWYWFTLGTLWVSYTGFSDLDLWRRLFRAGRPKRATSIMKPSEWEAFKQLPQRFVAYRSHRPNETDWISYTTNREIAERWTAQRGGHTQAYELQKDYCVALFLRRGEYEIIMLDPSKAKKTDS